MNVLLILILCLPVYISAECTCEQPDTFDGDKNQALRFKVIAIASILVAGGVGVCVPVLGKMFELFSAESNAFLVVKFFASGVILATGFVHVFPDANESLENPCLGDTAWGDFPLANFVAMLAGLAVMMVETAVTSLFNRSKCCNKTANQVGDKEKQHATASSEVLLRHRLISQVLEIGIIIHSVIIGISLGVSMHPKIIKPLIVALSFHQMFEGMGLGSCINEAKFKVRTLVTMLIFFSLTTPIGIAIGIGIANTYDENSRVALIVQGILNAASAGILIYGFHEIQSSSKL